MTFTVESYLWPIHGGRSPFNHQKITSLFLLKNKRAFVLNEMGTGKTLSVLWSCDMLLEAKKIRRTLVISPLSTMKAVWGKELLMNFPHRKFAIAHGTKQQRVAAFKSQAPFVIINHDGIKIMEEEIIAEQFDVIAIDELTAFSSSSERTKCMRRIADMQYMDKNRSRTRDGAVWGMTGEITPNSPVQAYWQCQIVNPRAEFLPRFYGQFRDATMQQINEMMWVPKPIAPQIVGMVTKPSIRFRRDECLDLPETTYQEMEIELSKEQAEFYDRMRKEAMVDAESGMVTASNAAVLLNKLCQISAGAVKTVDGSTIAIGCKPRMDALMEIFEGTPQRKLVVFATYRATIDMLMEELAKRGVRAACIHGDVRQDLRASHIDRFQNGDLEVIVLQPQSSAHGITLTAASTVVWFSLIASNELYQQGNARIVRAGQTRKTFVYYFVSTKAERHLANILHRKGNMSQETLALFTSGNL